MKFVIGAFVLLEKGLRARAEAKNPVLIPQLGGTIAAANGKLMQLNGVAPSPEFTKIAGLIKPMMGTLFAPLPTDKETYSKAADQVAEIAKKFADDHDGSKLAGIDGLLSNTTPHYSQQFKEKYLSR